MPSDKSTYEDVSYTYMYMHAPTSGHGIVQTIMPLIRAPGYCRVCLVSVSASAFLPVNALAIKRLLEEQHRSLWLHLAWHSVVEV